MKKIILSLAGVMTAVAFAPEALALPAFARQTGMACNACHQQHFPVLGKFGQAFKASGYTMMGSQGKVEGEHLSIPDTLNAAMLLKARYVKDDTAPATAADKVSTTGDGQWQIPDEFSLFFGGRISENIGFMFEGNTNAPALIAGFKMPFVFEAGDAKLLVIPYMTDALGAGYGFEQSSTGAVRGIRWAEHRLDISAQQYVGIGASAATGLAFVAINDMGYINVSKWAPIATLANPGAGGVTSNLGSTYVRIAATPTVGDWSINVGAQFASGNSNQTGASPAVVTTDLVETKASAVDLQAFGQVGDNPLSLYATYATAPAATAGVTNLFGNNDVNATKAFTLGADYSVIPNTVHLGAAYRNANTGAASNSGDNSITLAAIYDLSMNVALHLNHSVRSGSFYQPGVTGKKLTTFLLEAAW